MESQTSAGLIALEGITVARSGVNLNAPMNDIKANGSASQIRESLIYWTAVRAQPRSARGHARDRRVVDDDVM
jgi:hypothetical protein